MEEKSNLDPSIENSPAPLNTVSAAVRGSHASSATSLGSTHPYAVEIEESLKTKFYEMKWVWLSLVVNGFLIYGVWQLSQGLTVPLSVSIATSVGVVIIEVLLLVSNVITTTAVDQGSSAYFGYLLAERQGYSLAVCGFTQQASALEKAQFASKLSLNSTCRKILSRLSSLWLIVSVSLLLTPLSATAMESAATRTDEGTVNCLEFGQDGVPVDRGWPNVVVETGITEVVFGKAIGRLRSEEAVNVTTALITPQIVGAVNDGDTIVGAGYTLDILSNCVCAPTPDADGLDTAGVDSAAITPLVTEYNKLGHILGMANYIKNNTDNTMEIISVLSGTSVCGGANDTNPFVPVCTTKFWNHRKATMLIRYMTDGTPASIAPEYAEVREYGDDADFSTWVVQSMLYMMEGQLSHWELPNTIPGVVNPLLWWTTPNLMVIDPALFEAGIETTWTVMFRAAVQRSYSTSGTFCVKNIEIGGQCVLSIQGYGFQIAVAILVIQLITSIVAFAGFIPWVLASSPIGPAVRMTRDCVYFTTLVHSSNLFQSDHLCNAPLHTIWQALDFVVRVGESPNTKEDPLLGHIMVDKPKMVSSLTNGKRYF